MGNTNIPQFGAADTENSRDTLSGADQLTDEQRKQSTRDVGSTEPDPVPAASDPTRDTIPRKKPEESRAESGEGRVQASDKSIYVGHEDTGHSPSDAT